jgi:hypothetical protein
MNESDTYVLELSGSEFERLMGALDAAIASIDLQTDSSGLRDERKALRDIKKALLLQASPGLR